MGAGRLALFKIEFALRLVSWHSVRPAGPLASGSLVIRVFSFDLGLVASQIPGQALSAPASGLAREQARCWQVPWRLALGEPPRLALETRLPGQGR